MLAPTLPTILASISLTAAAATSFGSIVHYSPTNTSIGDLEAVFNPATGTNGGYYSGSFVPDDDYGAYDYCNMPHTRAREYMIPGGYNLQYVELIHRHHKRTPYASNTFPREDIAMYCDNVETVYYGKPKNGVNVTNIWWKNYQDPSNPMTYYKNGFNGTCQFPQISYAGLDDSAQHGRDLWSVYGEKLKFLPKTFDPATMRIRATSNEITSQVAGALVRAMYPHLSEVNVWQQISSVDSLEPGYSCSFADSVRSAYQDTDEWYQHLNLAKNVFDQLDEISGVDPNDSGWHSWFDHYFDNLSSRLCHQLPLPCKISNFSDCVSEQLAEQVFRLGDYEYNYIFRQAANSTLYSATHYGAFIAELMSHLKDKVAGTEGIIYRHNIAHDGSIAPLLGALQINALRWPGMGSEVIFELWRKEFSHDYSIRVLYGGRPLVTNTPLGTLDMVSYDDFVAYLESLVGNNGELVYQYCSSS
ncbi:histidine phosphatase superfamily [Lipomyces chichibuensis]|uniref:histidine phosphatase superfamily n=1 Tax=Lipomyces chichibuensis TaxID=1546026 RepID=UPI00334401B7